MKTYLLMLALAGLRFVSALVDGLVDSVAAKVADAQGATGRARSKAIKSLVATGAMPAQEPEQPVPTETPAT